MAESRAAPVEPLDVFLRAVRAPIEFLAEAAPAAAARTRFPALDLARRARSIESRTADTRRRELLAGLCRCLEGYDSAQAEERVAMAQRCRALLAELATAAAEPPPYDATHGDLGATIERLGGRVQFVAGVGPRRAPALARLGIETVEDLLYHLPFRYEDRRVVRTIAETRTDEETSLIGELVQLQERNVGRSRRRILEGVLRDETGLLGLTWYNMVPYFRQRYRVGQRYLVYGRIEASGGGGRRIVHPEIEPSADESGRGLLPVYEKPGSMSVAVMRKIVGDAVQSLADTVPSVLPPSIAARARVCDLATALRAVHLPEPDSDLAELDEFRSAGHRGLVFDELFFLQLGMILRRRAVAIEPGLAMPARGMLTDRLYADLPFPLTGAQRRVLEEIGRDMAEPRPMHRLVQGDVGSGKTIVALFAALVAIENGYQAAFMAPTELLAEQHFCTISRFAAGLGLNAALLTGSLPRADRTRILAELSAGTTQLVVGTHALIQDAVSLPRLGLGVIDEQHRFGVLQRGALRGLRAEGVAPDILLMSATPIPRTLTMTVYGDLDVSVLDEMPPGRKPVRTMIFSEAERRRAYELVKGELARGRQGYVVYPLVEASEKEELRDATTMARELGRAAFADYRVGLVHGRMKAEEKDVVMQRFRVGDLHVLVSTTVIEVGVDVPNATIMVVEHAERFGLAQLHQLRGRVGRGADDATCVLIAPYRRDAEAHTRLDVLRRTSDGFRIAEKDLELRGPGEFLGTRQSGLPDFRVANLIRDSRLLLEAREAAEQWLAQDPDLKSSESTLLRQVLVHRWAGRLGLAEIG